MIHSNKILFDKNTTVEDLKTMYQNRIEVQDDTLEVDHRTIKRVTTFQSVIHFKEFKDVLMHEIKATQRWSKVINNNTI